MPTTFDLETHKGFRKVEFDPDVVRFRDIRILVDGQRVAVMPYPKAATPYQEIAFRLGATNWSPSPTCWPNRRR